MCIYICQNSSNQILKIIHFIIKKSHLKENELECKKTREGNNHLSLIYSHKVGQKNGPGSWHFNMLLLVILTNEIIRLLRTLICIWEKKEHVSMCVLFP